MKILILSDRSTLLHPFGRLLFESLKKDGHDVRLATTDLFDGRAFYDFSKSKKILSGYGEIRLPIYKSIKYAIQKRHWRISPLLKFCINRIQKFDKSLTRFRSRHIAPTRTHFIAGISAYKFKADVVIVSRPQTAFVQLILLTLQKFKIKRIRFIYYPYEMYGQQYNKYKKIILFLEKYFIKNLYSGLVTPSHGRLDYYKSINPNIQGCVVRNFKEFRLPDKKASKQANSLNLVYLGLLDYGRKIEEIIDNLDHLPSNFKFILVGKARKNWLEDNQENINYWISLGKLELVEEIPEHAISQYLSLYHIGLISYDESCLNNRLCAPAKVTDYLHSGLQIVAPNLPGMKEISQLSSNITLYDSSDILSLFALLEKHAPILRSQDADFISNSSSNLSWGLEYSRFRDFLTSLSIEWAQTGSNRRPTD